MSPRAYDTTHRRERSLATRARLLEVTRLLIGGKGDLSEFSMDAVAERAGVARMTVYNQFRSRAGLLEALSDHLAERGGMRGVAGAMQEPDPERSLRALVTTFVGFWASDPVTMRRLRAMGVVSPSKDAAPRERDEWRRSAVRNVLAKFESSGSRLDPTRRDDLVDWLTVLLGFETYDGLALGRRRPEAIAERIFEESLRSIQVAGTASSRRTAARARGRGGGRSRARSGVDGSGTPGSPSGSRAS